MQYLPFCPHQLEELQCSYTCNVGQLLPLQQDSIVMYHVGLQGGGHHYMQCLRHRSDQILQTVRSGQGPCSMRMLGSVDLIRAEVTVGPPGRAYLTSMAEMVY